MKVQQQLHQDVNISKISYNKNALHLPRLAYDLLIIYA